MTGHIGTNTLKFVPPRCSNRAVQIRVGLELADITTIHADLSFSRVSRLRFRTPGAPIRKIQVYAGMLPNLVP